MTDAVIGFLGGVATTLIAAIAASLVQRASARHSRKQTAQHEIYMRLLSINQQYFWISSAQTRGERTDQEIVANVRTDYWKLADKLREFDTVQDLNDILEFLFSNGIASETERAKLSEKVLDRYGATVNPRYARKIAQISRDNIQRIAEGSMSSEPPTSWRL